MTSSPFDKAAHVAAGVIVANMRRYGPDVEQHPAGENGLAGAVVINILGEHGLETTSQVRKQLERALHEVERLQGRGIGT